MLSDDQVALMAAVYLAGVHRNNGKSVERDMLLRWASEFAGWLHDQKKALE